MADGFAAFGLIVCELVMKRDGIVIQFGINMCLDLFQGLGLRSGVIDGAISISAVQVTCDLCY